ncbi:hypothetical protein T4A_6065 [Trichinella pseudospiralis]|uniref:Uncharacterized protein n=1 Tax=Trichinella pseudospiralis TaxID=6337 RepID=A0A0V1ERG5_TRIPS|nr:hypothetical protein T4A_6065 [Trichinella pseudospiralis]
MKIRGGESARQKGKEKRRPIPASPNSDGRTNNLAEETD